MNGTSKTSWLSILGSFSPRIRLSGSSILHPVFHIYSDGRVEHPFDVMKAPFDTEEGRIAVIDNLGAAGFGFQRDQASKRPSITLRDVRAKADRWFDVWDWVVEETRRTQS